MPSTASFLIIGEPSDIENAHTLDGPTVTELRTEWAEVAIRRAVSFKGYVVKCSGRTNPYGENVPAVA